MAKALVTGASGFIGVHLTRALVAQGDDVTCLVRRTSRLEPLQQLEVRLAYGDVSDCESLGAAVADADVVYHVAGLIKALSKSRLYQVNESGVRNVLGACCARTSPPTVIVVSSLAAAGPARKGRPVTEHDSPAPVSNYGRSKLAGERAAEAFANELPITIVRPPIVIGPSDYSTWLLFKPIVRHGVHLVPGFSRQYFSLVHVDDLCTALLSAAQRGQRIVAATEGNHAQGRYFVSDEEIVTWADLGRLIAKAFGREKCRIVRMPKALVWLGGGTSELVAQLIRRPTIFGRDKVREATAGSWTCSTAAIRQQLGFKPAATLFERLRQTVKWYVDEGWL